MGALERLECGSRECSQVPQGAKAGQKEVSAADRSDERLDDGLLTDRFRWNAEGTLGSDYWVAFVVAEAKHRIEKPSVLNKLELALYLAVHADENEAAVDA